MEPLPEGPEQPPSMTHPATGLLAEGSLEGRPEIEYNASDAIGSGISLPEAIAPERSVRDPAFGDSPW